MSTRPQLFTRGLSSLGQSSDANSPAEQRDDAKRNFLKTMRPLPTQHYWNVYFDRHAKEQQPQGEGDAEYTAQLEQLGEQIESVQDFWRYNNNTPVDNIKMRESIYLFKAGFRPIWEDRRNILGGSWTFRVPKSIGPDVWNRVQLLAIGETLQGVLDDEDQLCGVGLSVRFNSHLISIWHRDASKQNSVDAILACILEDLPVELRPKPDSYFYKKHSDHAGFKAPAGLQAVIDSQKRAEGAAATQKDDAADDAADKPEVTVLSPQ
ncbi:translation initiation factor eIF 4e-like domain-containing protein [Dactylonectria estremocensis]|uniref:Translation initiation factor eIF 4e-like domain-containing protein n=1 Tax=Dactylonectria estremocensis TaxID=1079267 RepID=A0A9P9J7K7_9HYPO|nr:translation initiation factor eIF 4e-like domain-containing protein [Dactylonectria estremocensis]